MNEHDPGYVQSTEEISPTPLAEIQPGGLSRRLTAVVSAASLLLGLSVAGCTSSADTKLSTGAVAERIIDEDAAAKGGLDCSAFVVRDPITGKAVGALTAAHCGYANPEIISKPVESQAEPAWYASAAGGEYVTFRVGAEDVETGDNSDALQVVGKVSETLVATDGTSDEAVEVFQGSSLTEVLQDLNAELATEAEIQAMLPGETKIYVAGWPGTQNGDGHGHEELQRFTATYIGMGKAKIETGKTIDVIYAAVPQNSNGASCTPGISGSGAFILNGDGPALLGNVSVGYTTTANYGGPVMSKEIAELAPPGFDWSKYATVCGFAVPTLGEQPDTLLHVVTNTDEIPRLIVDSLSDANDLFGPPGYIPTTIDGVVVGVSRSEVDGKVIETSAAYRNPIVFVNPNGSAVIYYYDGQTRQFQIQEFTSMSDLRVYADTPNGEPSILHRALAVYGTDAPGDNTLGGFVDGETEYGVRYTELPSVDGTVYRLSNEEGRLALTANH